MGREKGFSLSLNAVITIVIGVVLVAAIVAIATGFFEEGKNQVMTLAGF